MAQPVTPARVSIEMVFDAIWSYPKGALSTFEIAEQMGVPEYPVRAVMSWLLNRKVIEKAGARKRYTAPSNEAYWATKYTMKPQTARVDFAALMVAF